MLSEHKGIAYTWKSVYNKQEGELQFYPGIYLLYRTLEHSKHKALNIHLGARNIHILQKPHILPLKSTICFDLLEELIPAITYIVSVTN